MSIFMQDILSQVNHAENALNYYFSSECLNILDKVSKRNYSKIIFTGMGSSNYANISASLFLNENKINSIVMSAGQFLHYSLNIVDNKTLLILVSQSGESAEITNLLYKIGDKANVLGITNNPESTLARIAKYSLLLQVENEVSVTSRTYITTLIVTHLLAKYLVHNEKDCRAEFIGALESLKLFLKDYKNRLNDIDILLKDVKFICCIGRGPSYASAMIGGLYLKEASKFPSEGMDSAEFRHGAIEIVGENFGAIVFAPKGRTSALSLKIASDIAIKGGKVILMTDQERVIKSENITVFKYKYVDEYLAPIVEVAGIQLLCLIAAKKIGVTPGEFRWISKVTTDE